MGVGAGLYMYDVVVKKFTFAISSPDEFLSAFPTSTVLRANPPFFTATVTRVYYLMF